MKILIIGGGGREHALAWKCARSPRVGHVFVAPGNAGTALEPNISNVDIAADDSDALIEFAEKENIDLTVVGPEGPLVAGIVDRFTAADFNADFVRAQRLPLVVKADGLAAGKGVVICESHDSAIAAATAMLGGSFGAAGNTVVIEEFLRG